MSRPLFPLLAVLAAAATTLATPTLVDTLVPAAHAESAPRVIAVRVAGGYTPEVIHIAAGERVRLVFTRTEYNPCSREVVFRELGIRAALPVNEAVTVDLPVLAPGTWHFDCWMDMLHGSIVVAAPKP